MVSLGTIRCGRVLTEVLSSRVLREFKKASLCQMQPSKPISSCKLWSLWRKPARPVILMVADSTIGLPPKVPIGQSLPPYTPLP
jgi:hypothetical protein